VAGGRRARAGCEQRGRLPAAGCTGPEQQRWRVGPRCGAPARGSPSACGKVRSWGHAHTHTHALFCSEGGETGAEYSDQAVEAFAVFRSWFPSRCCPGGSRGLGRRWAVTPLHAWALGVQQRPAVGVRGEAESAGSAGAVLSPCFPSRVCGAPARRLAPPRLGEGVAGGRLACAPAPGSPL